MPESPNKPNKFVTPIRSAAFHKSNVQGYYNNSKDSFKSNSLIYGSLSKVADGG